MSTVLQTVSVTSVDPTTMMASTTTHVYDTSLSAADSSAQPVASIIVPAGATALEGTFQVATADPTQVSQAEANTPNLVKSSVIDVTFVVNGTVCIGSCLTRALDVGKDC